jgi:hypothetical protein
VFDFFDNRSDPNPAAVVFEHFPLPDDNFKPPLRGKAFDGIDHALFMKGDKWESEKFLKTFSEHLASNKVDYAAFIRECVDHFEDFQFDGKEIITVDDFLGIGIEAWTLIADDCYQYALQRDKFSMGDPLLKG